ncbi:MAG TPA: hypothetical protein VNZ52_04895, partial [Candidatus Thermoplasmatota archaeon]|nr:hypothetical protein [Candidatus Thermoplasmatota archaeon]
LPPVDPGTNWVQIALIAGAVLVLGGGGYALLARRKKPTAAPRSQTLQRIEMERQIERLEKKAEEDPEAAAQVEALKQEQREQELVRQKSRERMIVEAKRDDALKSIDLLKKRREAGQLTELQFNKMMEKKTEQLEALERELSEMDARGE